MSNKKPFHHKNHSSHQHSDGSEPHSIPRADSPELSASHSHYHSHTCAHVHHKGSESNSALIVAFLLNAGFCVIEGVGGYIASSQAIMADALHDFGDSLSLLLLITLRYFATKPAKDIFSFGYRRLNIIGAAVVGGSLVIGCLIILGHSLPKLLNPTVVNSSLMIGLSVGGIIVNGIAFYRLRGVSGLGESLVSLHLLEDLWGWVIVFFGALAIHFYSWYWLDPLLSVFLAFFILWRTFSHLQEVGRLFLLGSGEGFSMAKISEQLNTVEGVSSFHHVHVWELDSGFHIITAHLVLKIEADTATVKQLIRNKLLGLGKCEVTLEIEREGETCLDPVHPTSF